VIIPLNGPKSLYIQAFRLPLLNLDFEKYASNNNHEIRIMLRTSSYWIRFLQMILRK
jgi:hypothetical protein